MKIEGWKPAKVVCVNCGNEIVVSRRHMDPGNDVPTERVIRAYKPNPPYLVFCIECHHFMVLSPETDHNTN